MKISVVVPVYNAEKYVERCVNSILNQSFKDFELILVDDGSTDSSAKICDDFALSDERVRVLHKENGGHASARNRGIDLAFESESLWITFIDSDDWVDINYLEYLYKSAIDANVDISVCSYIRIHNLDDIDDNLTYSSKEYKPEDFWCESRINATIPCGKLYKKEMFDGIRWPNKVHDDEHMTYKLLFACDKITFINAPLYNYYYNENSVMVSTWSPKRVDSVYAIKERREYFLENDFKQAYDLDTKLYIQELYDTLLKFKEIKDEHKETYDFLRTELKHELKVNGNIAGYSYKEVPYMYAEVFTKYKNINMIKVVLSKCKRVFKDLLVRTK